MISSIIKKIRNSIPGIEEIQFKRVKPWVKVQGDKSLRLDYDLKETSIVFDLGGFEGQWASDIFAKYLCKVYVFEPYLPFYENIKRRFALNEKIQVFSFGLAAATIESKISFNGDNTSSHINKEANVGINLVSFTEFIESNNLQSIDLIKINIEGAEYDLLEYLLENGQIERFKNIQVQFHDFVPNASQRVLKIRTQLQLTHRPTYLFDFVWENWELINK